MKKGTEKIGEILRLHHSYLNECFLYDPILGTLLWRERPESHFVNENRWKGWNTCYAGKDVGTKSVDKRGYKRWFTSLFYVHVHVSRIVYTLIYGKDPRNLHVKHRDDDIWNIKSENIELFDMKERIRNLGQQRVGAITGHQYIKKDRDKFIARVYNKNNKLVSLGSFNSVDDAIKAKEFYFSGIMQERPDHLECEGCGQIFTKNRHSKYCNRSCYEKHYYISKKNRAIISC